MHERTTHSIVHAGFRGVRAYVSRKKLSCKLISNRLLIPHDTLPSTVKGYYLKGHQNMIKQILLILLFEFLLLVGYSQTVDIAEKQDFLSIQTGQIIDKYNSTGIRLFFEYKKDMKGRWQYGISFETSRHNRVSGMEYADNLPTNLNLLNFNYYFKLNPRSNRMIWALGIGFGGVHVFWNENKDSDRFGLNLNASFTASIKLSEKMYIECSPSIALLPNRIYFSSMNVESFNNFYAFTFFPFGFKFKL